MKELCTIIMPVYNREEYIEQAIQSVLSQKTVFNYKLVIADDSSSDNSMQIAERYKEVYPDIIETLYSDKNVGLLANNIRVWENMKSDYFCVLDPDDYWISDMFLQKALDFLEKNPEYVCYSSNTIIEEEHQPNRALIVTEQYQYTTNSIRDYLEGKAIIPHTTAAVWRNVIYKFGVPKMMRAAVGTKSEASFRADHGRFVMHIKYGKANFVNEFVGVYRVHKGGIWSGSKAVHRYLLNAQQKFDHSNYYEGLYEKEFKSLALQYYKRAVAEYEKMEMKGEKLQGVDEEIYDSLRHEFDYNDIKLALLKQELQEKQSVIEKLLLEQRSLYGELIWANIFHDTIKGSKWMPENLSISPGRWAVGYPGLYVLYRVLDELKPQAILELGLGQSTKFTGNYAKYQKQNGELCKHYVVEHDRSWIEFFGANNEISDTEILNLKMTEIDLQMEKGRTTKVNVYVNFGEAVKGEKFDLIFIDAPIGSDEFSRIDVIDILPECLGDRFVIIMDDYNRMAEKRTVGLIKEILEQNSIACSVGVYSGEKSTALIVSEGLEFLLTM